MPLTGARPLSMGFDGTLVMLPPTGRTVAGSSALVSAGAFSDRALVEARRANTAMIAPAAKRATPPMKTHSPLLRTGSLLPRRTTAFACRAGCKERDVSTNRHAGWLSATFGTEHRVIHAPCNLMTVHNRMISTRTMTNELPDKNKFTRL